MAKLIKWFEAELVFRIVDHEESAFEKQNMILKAIDKKDAYQKALIAASQEVDKRNYNSNSGQVFEYLGLEKLEKTESASSESFSQSILEAPNDLIEFVTSLRFINLLLQKQLTQIA